MPARAISAAEGFTLDEVVATHSICAGSIAGADDGVRNAFWTPSMHAAARTRSVFDRSS